MRSITAVEIGADTCALASTSVRGPELYVTAAETLDPASFPGIEAFTMALQQTRKALKLPRRCRAVVWGLPDGATKGDPIVASLIEPLTRAGFKVARVVTPCNALGALARLRTSKDGGAMCWLGINRNGVAVIVIRPGKLLYSHSFAWDSNVGASGSQARLLQRYSLVAFLAPEVRRAIAIAKQKGGVVDGIVTCGNLPDLRSLTMPLIEELDIEVETLDSLEGLQMKADLADRLAEVAPAIRLACAGAFARETRTVDEAKRKRVRRGTAAATLMPIAVLLAVLAGGGYWYYTQYVAPKPAPVVPRNAPRPAPTPPPQVPAKQASAKQVPPQIVTPKQTPPPAVATPPPVTPPVAATPSATTKPTPTSAPPSQAASVGKPAPAPPSQAAPVGKPAPALPSQAAPVGKPAPPSQAASVGKPASAPASQSASIGKPASPAPPVAQPAPPPTTPKQTAPSAAPPVSAAASVPAARRTVNPAPGSTDKPEADSAVRPPQGRAAQPAGPMPELLKDPVPRVTAILVSADRRLATVGDEGQIIAVGDTIGRRVVVGIDDRTVLLKEPSGVQIRVALGGRVVSVERGSR